MQKYFRIIVNKYVNALSSGMNLMELGQHIKTARKEEGLTQDELGAKIGTSKEGISRIEKGKQNITFEMLGKIAAALNRRINDDLLIK